MGLTESIYYLSPYPVKCWMASRYGKKLLKLRFGEEYEGAKKAIRSRNTWSIQKFQGYQLERLQSLVRHCAAHVPYYRKLFASISLKPGDIQSLADIERIPITEKDVFRSNSHEFIDERLDPSTLISEYTSGTTGTPLSILRSINENATAYAYNAIRLYEQTSFERNKRKMVTLSSKAVCSQTRKTPPFWVVNRTGQQMVMSSFHLREETYETYIEEIRRFNPYAIEGYPSSIYPLAYWIIKKGLPPVPVKGIFTTAENLFESQREVIEKAFECRIFDQYGCAEQVAYSAQCTQGNMHLSPDHSILEVVGPDDKRVEPGIPGDVIGTSLESFSQPLLRFRVGDKAVLASTDETCTCGSPLPLLSRVLGRADDILLLRDGRRMGRLMAVFGGATGVREAQIIQETLDDICVRIVGDSTFTRSSEQAIITNLKKSIGNDVAIRIEKVAEIPRTASGKMKFIINRIPDDLKQKLLAGTQPDQLHKEIGAAAQDAPQNPIGDTN